MKAKVYIETTIPSYLVARPSRDLLIAAHQQLTRDWWELRRPAFDLYVSDPVLEEAGAGDATLAKEAARIAGRYSRSSADGGHTEICENLVAEGPIPSKAVGDAFHI